MVFQPTNRKVGIYHEFLLGAQPPPQPIAGKIICHLLTAHECSSLSSLPDLFGRFKVDCRTQGSGTSSQIHPFRFMFMVFARKVDDCLSEHPFPLLVLGRVLSIQTTCIPFTWHSACLRVWRFCRFTFSEKTLTHLHSATLWEFSPPCLISTWKKKNSPKKIKEKTFLRFPWPNRNKTRPSICLYTSQKNSWKPNRWYP